MSQITIRDLPDSVERAIRRRAAQEKKSMNKTVGELLQKALGIESSEQKQRDLSAFSGAWNPAEADEFDRQMEPFETIDEEVWR